ncbi:MAG: L,D-transpeptidase family protein [Alphaproteobacteria bacterium]
MKSGSIASALRRSVLIGAGGVALAACSVTDIPKHLKPVPHVLIAKMERQKMKEAGAIFVRIFKESSELEVWKERTDGTYALLKTYDVCKWSGVLGPKQKEGDRQAPEGFYTVAPAQMNPNSSFYLSFNIGYPNTFDTALGRTGSHLMVHGACSSAGCYSMTDKAAGEIFSLARDAFRGGQRDFQIQAFPFRMTTENFVRHRDDPNMPFWRALKEGHDHFEVTRRPPKIDVCNKRYVFNAEAGDAIFDPTGACPSYQVPPEIAAAVELRRIADDQALAVALAALTAKEQKAAAKAARPSLLSRIMQRTALRPQGPATPIPAAAEGSIRVASMALQAGGRAPVPLPRLRPNRDSSLAVVTPKASFAEEPLSSGRFVKRPFLWPDG